MFAAGLTSLAAGARGLLAASRRMMRSRRLGACSKVCLVLIGLALAGCAGVPGSVDHGIPNFKEVNSDYCIYRGGQPQSAAAWAYLQTLGVSNVVKLNLEAEGSDDGARACGMVVTYFPIGGMQQRLLQPSLQSVSNAVAAITPGTYIHCKKGQDRTGLIVGCKRVWQDGWNKANAWQEMMAGGFHPMLRGLNDFWQEAVHQPSPVAKR